MIPSLIEIAGALPGIKYLPPGIHNVSLSEVESVYTYNIFRKELFEGLKLLINDLKIVGCNTIYLDGSFVTSKAIPKDIDVCWEESSGTNYMLEQKTLPILWNRREAMQKYKADVFPARVTEGASGLLFLDFFQRIKHTDIKKGIIQLDII